MSYGSPQEHNQDMFQYGYSTSGHGYHYISDGSTIGGDETNFWSNSPRSDSPSPNNINSQSSYQIYSPVDCSNNKYSTYRATTYTSITSEPGRVPFVRVAKRRTTANKKERRRTQSINNAYADLKNRLHNKCIPADTKLSKIKTLRLATSYISYLTRVLETDDPEGGFKAELESMSRKSSSHNSLQNNSDCSGHVSPKSDCSEDLGNNSRKTKGRTGWPQHMWALELKQEQSL